MAKNFETESEEPVKYGLTHGSIRTESLERILGDKAETFFKSMERTLQL